MSLCIQVYIYIYICERMTAGCDAIFVSWREMRETADRIGGFSGGFKHF